MHTPDVLGWVKRSSDIEIAQISNLIELSDLIGFDYDLSDTQDGLKCWWMGFIFLVNILSSWQGFRWAIQGPWVLWFSCCLKIENDVMI